MATIEDILAAGVELRQSRLDLRRAEQDIERLRRSERVADLRRLSFQDQSQYIEHQIDVWMQHVDQFGYTRTAADKMPRADAWRPYRFAVQDVILALTALRYSKPLRCIEIDVFLASDPSYGSVDDIPEGQTQFPYEPLAAHRALTLMLLSEAFRCGVPLRLRFTRNVDRTSEERAEQERQKLDRGRVPFAICALAESYGITGIDRESGVLEPGPASELYRRLSGFSPTLDARVEELSRLALLTVERACYLVQHGVWSVQELEGLIQSCPYPDLALDGEVQPEQRHLYNHVQFHTRTALLGGVLDRALLARDPTYDDKVDDNIKRPKGRIEGAQQTIDPVKPGKDVEDDERDLSIESDAASSARVYRLGPIEKEPMRLPDWRPHAARDTGPCKAELNTGERLIALLRPRDEAGMLLYLADDLRVAREYPIQPADQVALVVPLDFNDLTSKQQIDFFTLAAQANVHLLVCPESTKTLDAYARDKLTRSRVLPE